MSLITLYLWQEQGNKQWIMEVKGDSYTFLYIGLWTNILIALRKRGDNMDNKMKNKKYYTFRTIQNPIEKS